jgi:hypothetical protein
MKNNQAITVGIAAICENGIMLGAADRMVSATGYSKYSPFQTNILHLKYDDRDRILLMIAGNIGLQTEIIQVTRKKLNESTRKGRLSVKEVINAYCSACRELILKKAESAILIPMGLNLQKYYEKKSRRELGEKIHNDIIQSIETFSASFKSEVENKIETIVMGEDEDGQHIYVLKFDDVRCETKNGFAAIGGGSQHAEYQFLLAQYTRNWSLSDALFLLYKAKKKTDTAEQRCPTADLPFLFLPRKKTSGEYVVRPISQKVHYQLVMAYKYLEWLTGGIEHGIRQDFKQNYNRRAKKII